MRLFGYAAAQAPISERSRARSQRMLQLPAVPAKAEKMAGNCPDQRHAARTLNLTERCLKCYLKQIFGNSVKVRAECAVQVQTTSEGSAYYSRFGAEPLNHGQSISRVPREVSGRFARMTSAAASLSLGRRPAPSRNRNIRTTHLRNRGPLNEPLPECRHE